MSNQIITVQTGDQLTVNTDLSRIFLWENRYSTASYNNSTYATQVIKAGTLLGRIAANQFVAPCISTAVDGSQIPRGILADDMTILAGAIVNMPFCTDGDVAADKVIFLGAGDGFNTLVNNVSLRDRIAADTVGIRLINSDEQTNYDN